MLGLSAYGQTTVNFSCTSAPVNWVVPPCVTSIDVIVAGAQGGGSAGGMGATVTGTLAVIPGQILQINVGCTPTGAAAGYNGGGPGNGANSLGNQSYGGGGASGISVAPFGPADQLIVAAGGGGTGGGTEDGDGGNGGCATGAVGAAPFGVGGNGGTQAAGGAGGPSWAGLGNSGSNGGFGFGGAGATDPCFNNSPGGGGGGGYYGGGGGGSDCFSGAPFGGGGGGGGSSLTPAGGGCVAGNNAGSGDISISYTGGDINLDENLSSCDPITVNGTVYTTSQTVVNTYSTASGCDSVVTSNITIFLNPPPTINNIIICDGESYIEGSDIYFTSGVYNYTYLTPLGCDSIVTTDLTVAPTYASTNNVSICEGDSYVEGTSVYTTSGVYTDPYLSTSGCDSVITTDLTVIPAILSTNTISICEGESYTEGTSIYTSSGVYTDFYISASGCDSIITTDLTVSPTFATTNSVDICEGDSYIEGASVYTTSGTYTDIYPSVSGCDSVITTILSVAPTYASTNIVNICEGDNYSEGTSVYTTSGVYTDQYLSASGCDSIITTDLTVIPAILSTNSVSICEGESYIEGTSVYNSSGVYTDIYVSNSGCDSIITTDLTVSPTFATTNNVDICDGDSYVEGTSVYTVSGTYTDIYLSGSGCDSIITTFLTVDPVYASTNTISICEGESYTEGTSVYTTTGLYTDNYLTSSGCDSIITTDLTVTPVYAITNTVSICDGGSYSEGTSVYTVAGTYVDTYQANSGCDSLVTTILTVTEQYEVTNEVSICEGESYTEGSSVYTMTGLYQDSYISSIGCDSIVTTDLTVNSTSSITNQVTICEGESYTEGSSNYTVSGVFIDSYVSMSGCDSVITTVLSVLPGYSITNEPNICSGGSYIEGTSVYTETGNYVDTYQTVGGCDSIITTVLTVIDQFEVTNVLSICDGESYTEGSSVYSVTGLYQDSYISSLGCDSLVTTDLMVGSISSITNEVSICEGDSYTEGSSVYTMTGIFIDSYVSAFGCDSVITTVLTVSAVYSISNDPSICSGGSYTEGTSVYTETGTYVDTYQTVEGCDSIITTELTVIDQFEVTNEVSICDGESYTEGSSVYSLTGVYEDVYISTIGCDSVVTTDLTVEATTSITDQVSICEGETYTQGSSIYILAGVYTDVYQTSLGCDSIVITELTVDPAVSVSNEVSICEGGEYMEGSSVYSDEGTYTDVYQSVSGCDSTVTTILSMYPDPSTTNSIEICLGESYIEGTSIYDETGVYTDIYTSLNGCDSVVTTDLTVTYCCEPNNTFIEMRFCESLPIDTDFVFILEGIFDSTFVAVDGCDSIVTTHVILDPSYYILNEVDICEGESYIVGDDVYDSTGLFSTYYETTLGCDSVLALDLQIHSPSEVLNDFDLCEGEILMVGNSIYAEAGLYVDSLQSQIGCDSIVTSLVTVVDNPITATDTTICEGEVIDVGGNTYDQTGVYTSVYPSVMGCDSTVVMTLIVGPEYEEVKEVILCEGESHFEGDSEYFEDGIYNDTYDTRHGCDSVITTIIEVVQCHCSVFAPNAVTADGDDVNDSFQIEFDCDFYEYELMIFDRWGKMIFSTGDPQAIWIPSSIGSNFYVQDGMYTYRLQYSYIDHSTELPVGPIRKTGSITVLR